VDSLLAGSRVAGLVCQDERKEEPMFGIFRFGVRPIAACLPLFIAIACGGEAAEVTELGSLSEALGAGDRLNVMSFNVRIPEGSGEQSWSNRLPRIAGVINSFAGGGPHLIGFQEMKTTSAIDTAADVWRQLPLGYWYYPVDRGPDDEVIAIFVRPDRLEVLDFGHRNVTAANRNCADDDPKNRPIQYVLVRDKISDRKNYFYNTHYPSGHSCGRKRQSEILVGYIATRSDPSVRAILVGDFNDGYEADGHRNGSMNPLALNGFTSAFFMPNATVVPASQLSSYMTCTTATADCTKPPTYDKVNRVGKYIDHIMVKLMADVVMTGIDRSMFRRSDDTRVVCENVVNGRCTGNQVSVDQLEMYSDHWATWASIVQ
jgi:endonuclease/exonuclease/phosphatase family metal-dependent hydrolase